MKLFCVISAGPYIFIFLKTHEVFLDMPVTTAIVLRISSEAANKQVKWKLASYLLSYLIFEGFLNWCKKE